MQSRDESVSFSVSEDEKRAIRTAAAKRDLSMAEFARRATLGDLGPDELPAADRSDGHDLSPFEDFHMSQVQVSEEAGPTPKVDLYAAYTEWAEQTHGRVPESRTKFVQKLNRQPDVEQGRVYIDGKRQRSFLNVELRPR